MSLSAREAAEEVGLSRDGILKAIRTGKLSAQKNQNGEWRIEPVELFRVYEAVHTNGSAPVHDSPQTTIEASTESLQVEIRQLHQRLADKDDVIADLRQRLDAATEQNTRLEAVLTTQLQPPKAKPNWWQRLLGGA